MKTPWTDEYATQIIRLDETVEVVNANLSRRLERDLRVLILGTFALYEEDPLNFAPETCAVFDKWKPEIEKMLQGDVLP